MARKNKYPTVDSVPDNALPVTDFAQKFKIKNPSYVHTMYDRHLFGAPLKHGGKSFREHPGFDIISFKGNCYVINYENFKKK